MDLEKTPREQPEPPFPERPEALPRLDPQRLAAYLEELRRCNECALREGATRLVPGEGSPNSPIMLVGEAPGYEEDRLGRPFAGPSGQLFDRTLAKLGVARSQIYISNVIKY